MDNLLTVKLSRGSYLIFDMDLCFFLRVNPGSLMFTRNGSGTLLTEITS